MRRAKIALVSLALITLLSGCGGTSVADPTANASGQPTIDPALIPDAAPADAFRMPETAGVAVSFALATGEKCARCWKVLPDVGTHSHEGVCGRCDEAV